MFMSFMQKFLPFYRVHFISTSLLIHIFLLLSSFIAETPPNKWSHTQINKNMHKLVNIYNSNDAVWRRKTTEILYSILHKHVLLFCLFPFFFSSSATWFFSLGSKACLVFTSILYILQLIESRNQGSNSYIYLQGRPYGHRWRTSLLCWTSEILPSSEDGSMHEGSEHPPWTKGEWRYGEML